MSFGDDAPIETDNLNLKRKEDLMSQLQPGAELPRTPRPTILERLFAVQQSISGIAKKGDNQAQRYKFVQEVDVVSQLRSVLHANGLMLLCMKREVVADFTRETRNGGTERIVRARACWRLVCPETREAVEFEGIGEGADTSDKAVYKAHTGADKYVLKGVGMLAFGEDPEGDEETDKRNASPRKEARPPKKSETIDPEGLIPPKLQADLGRLMKDSEHGITDVKAWLAVDYGVESLAQVKHKDYEAIAKRLADKAPLQAA